MAKTKGGEVYLDRRDGEIFVVTEGEYGPAHVLRNVLHGGIHVSEYSILLENTLIDHCVLMGNISEGLDKFFAEVRKHHKT